MLQYAVLEQLLGETWQTVRRPWGEGSIDCKLDAPPPYLGRKGLMPASSWLAPMLPLQSRNR